MFHMLLLLSTDIQASVCNSHAIINVITSTSCQKACSSQVGLHHREQDMNAAPSIMYWMSWCWTQVARCQGQSEHDVGANLRPTLTAYSPIRTKSCGHLGVRRLMYTLLWRICVFKLVSVTRHLVRRFRRRDVLKPTNFPKFSRKVPKLGLFGVIDVAVSLFDSRVVSDLQTERLPLSPVQLPSSW